MKNVTPQRRVRVIVKGKVQGVFFRETTRQEADARGVCGWVKNLPSGEVEAVFEGAAEAVQELIEFCHRGPRLASVKQVEVIEEEVSGQYTDFAVLRKQT